MRGIDLRGKTTIVTGGYSGLGKETVRVFLAAGARVIVPARDVPRATAALADLPGVEVEFMDLLDPASIDDFAGRFADSGAALHILVNNAGIMAGPLTRDTRGYESQFAVNHLGHFQLVQRLWPALIRANGARVVSVSSLAHRLSPVVFEDVNFEQRPYDPWVAYGQAKSANVLFAVELDKRGRDHGIRAFSLHPGAIADTNLGKHMTKEEIESFNMIDAQGRPIIDPARGMKSTPQGAATQVWCATSPQLDGLGGVFCEDAEISPLFPDEAMNTSAQFDPVVRGVASYAIDSDNAARLWELSEKMLA